MRRSIVLLLALTACAAPPENWTKPGGTAVMLEQDNKQCGYEAMVAVAPMNADWAYKGGYAAELGRQCMQARGWAKS
ncbi:MAG: hypothetical protein K0R61_114 [Microvirga sp.]|jgi:hypothetical protein|nr:hypothetical protein [Microvirga sp.]